MRSERWARVGRGGEETGWARKVTLVRWEAKGGFRQGCCDLNALTMSLTSHGSEAALLMQVQRLSTQARLDSGESRMEPHSLLLVLPHLKYCLWTLLRASF